eukprot:9251420-Pyramimonas_sp.AAC.1
MVGWYQGVRCCGVGRVKVLGIQITLQRGHGGMRTYVVVRLPPDATLAINGAITPGDHDVLQTCTHMEVQFAQTNGQYRVWQPRV